MGIREEIEKLRASYKSLPTPGPVEEFGEQIFNDILSILDEHLTDTITLTRQEVREARQTFKNQGMPCEDFLDWNAEECGPEEGGKEDIGDAMKIIHSPYTAYCRLCRRLTEFAKESR